MGYAVVLLGKLAPVGIDAEFGLNWRPIASNSTERQSKNIAHFQLHVSVYAASYAMFFRGCALLRKKSEKEQFADGGSTMRVRSATYISCAAVGFIATSIFAWPTIGAESAAAVPDLSGLWAREFLGFDPPESGPGPIANTSRLPNGQSSLRQLVGDYTNPILKPEAAEILKKRGEIRSAARPFPIRATNVGRNPALHIVAA